MNEEGTVKKIGPWTLLAPQPGVCQTCAVDHPPTQPHNQQSIYYQYSFYADHKRWPTWSDAMAHCDEATQELWSSALKEKGVKFP